MQVNHPLYPNRNTAGILMVLLAAILMSTKAIVAKFLYVRGLDPVTVIALRLCFSAPLYALFMWFNRHESTHILTTRSWIILILTGIFGVYGSMWFDFTGLQFVSAGLERSILYLYPTMVVVFNSLLFKERPNKTQLLALVISYLGVLLIVNHDMHAPHLLGATPLTTLLGIALVFASAVTYAGYMVASGRLIPQIGAARFSTYTLAIALICSITHALKQQPLQVVFKLDSTNILLLLFMAVVATVIPFILVSEGTKRIGSSQASLLGAVGPVSTIIIAYLFLNEAISSVQCLGTALVLIGVLLISKNKHP